MEQVSKEGSSECHLRKTDSSNWYCESICGNHPLHCAIKSSNKEALRDLIQRNASLDEIDENGFTALHIAISSKNEFAASLLLKNGCAKDIKTSAGQTALHLAVRLKLLSTVKDLLACGCDVKARDCDGNTALHLVYILESVDNELQYVSDQQLGDSMVSLFLGEGVDVNARNNTGHTLLHIAAIMNRRTACRKILDNNADVNAVNTMNQNALHLAAMADESYSVCRLLLERGCQVNIVDTDGNCALHYAAMRIDLDLIHLLLSKGADIRATNAAGQTILHIAINHPQTSESTIQFLMLKMACIDAQDNNGDTPLHYAIERCRSDDDTYMSEQILSALLAWLPNLKLENNSGATAFSRTHNNFSEHMLRQHIIKMELVRMPVNVLYQFDRIGYLEFKESCLKELDGLKYVLIGQKSLFSIFSLCDSEWDLDELKEAVLKVNIAVSFDVYRLMLKAFLIRAVQRAYLLKGVMASTSVELPSKSLSIKQLEDLLKTDSNSHVYLKAVKLFMDSLIYVDSFCDDTNVKRLSSLKLVQDHCIEEFIQVFKENPSEVNAQDCEGNSYLHYCVRYNFKKGVNFLLTNGANINIENNIGNTPLLLCAVCTKLEELLELLLDKGADLYDENNYGENLMGMAIRRDRYSLVELLIDKGYKIGHKNKNGSAAINLLFKWGDSYGLHDKNIQLRVLNMCHVLIDETVDLNTRDNGAMTALHEAVMAGYPPVFLKVLLDKGADVNSKGPKNRTPLHIASFRSSTTASIRYLLDNGADINAQDDDGDTPLHCSVSHDDYYNHSDEGDHYNNTEVIELLVDNGASLFTENIGGITPLDLGLHSDVRYHFVKCFIKLQLINMVPGSAIDFQSARYRELKQCLLGEVDKMKDRKFGEVSLYDLFNEGGLRCVSNESLVKFISSPTLHEEFPSYCDLLKLLLKKSQVGKYLLGKGTNN